MATGTIKKTPMYPEYTQYKSLDSVAANGTFTVDQTGFYVLYVSATSNQTATVLIRTTVGNPIAQIQAVSGGAFTTLVYLKANTTYTLKTKLNTDHVYLYY